MTYIITRRNFNFLVKILKRDFLPGSCKSIFFNKKSLKVSNLFVLIEQISGVTTLLPETNLHVLPATYYLSTDTLL